MDNIEITITFEITDEPRGEEKRTATGTTDVPGNWYILTENDQREYLIKPRTSHQHRGRILSTSSRFQEIAGSDPVSDFDFAFGVQPIITDAESWALPLDLEK